MKKQIFPVITRTGPLRWLLFGLILSLSPAAYAQSGKLHRRFYTGMETGPAWLQLSRNGVTGQRTARFSLGFNGGYIISEKIRAGISLDGYLIESYGSFYTAPEKGISISNTHLQVQVDPFRKVKVFVVMAGGWSAYTNHHPDEYNSRGFSVKTGIGYRIPLGSRISGSVQTRFSSGQFRDVKFTGISVTGQHFTTFEVLAGFTYR